MRVVGTAGHVDHGKSTLVQALTGTHPDRLKEEREREMTIDLGFAFLTLPGGEELGIVDVPGHRDFIENMLAGVGGIDAALFVVAADEGVMPQTREHLAILDLLQVDSGIVALSKTDLVDDPDWLDLVEDEVKQSFRGTVLENAPLVRVSARSGAGVEDLLRSLSDLLAGRPPRPDLGRPRLPVDRVFSIAGFGTVVTGTLTDGYLFLGDDIEIQPAGLKGRVRGLQSHNHSEEQAAPGTRTAVNISGVRIADVERGAWVVRPGSYPATRRLDLEFRMLAGASLPLKHNAEVKFFIGAAEVMGRVRVLGTEVISPGESGWIQVELADPVLAQRGDRYILRRPSPGETIGGGSVIDPQPAGRHKRFSDQVLQRLQALAGGAPEEVFLQAALRAGLSTLGEITRLSALEADLVEGLIESLIDAGDLVLLEHGPLAPDAGTRAAHRSTWERTRDQILADTRSFHERFPLRRGIPREELRSRLGGDAGMFNALIGKLAGEQELVEVQALVALAGYTVRFSQEQRTAADRLLSKFESQPFSPPSVKQALAEAGEDLLAALLDQGDLVQVSPEVLFLKSVYDEMRAAVSEMIRENGLLTVAEFRDRFSTSRKYALGLLEHLDSIGVTVRAGDGRVLKGTPLSGDTPTPR